MADGTTQPNIGAGSTGTTPPPAGTPAPAGSSGGGSGPPTGAGGNTGVVGSTPSHPGSTAPPPPKIPRKVWNETPQGHQLQTAYSALHQSFQSQLPAARHQLALLKSKPLGG